MKTMMASLIATTFLLSSAASANELVKTIMTCTTSGGSSGPWPGNGSNKPYLAVQVSEILRPKAYMLTVSWVGYQQPVPPLPQDPNSGYPGPFPPQYNQKLISHQQAQIQTSGVGRETVIVSRDFALRINLFKAPQGYPAVLVEMRTRTQTPLFCQ